ncbi:MAG: hypothetical protein LBL24_07830, partial [Bacteroidales bacterium]|nr:hypothetical protein [Bacteroidales bacterium]
MFRIRFTLAMMFVFSQVQMYPQDNFNSIVDIYQAEYDKHPLDLLYFQTSKDIYESGEDLWFKAYLLNSRSFELSTNSKTLYLQLSSENDSIVWQEIYPLSEGIATGHIYLDEKLSAGNYYLNGFTKYSVYRDDTSGIIPTRKIRIIKDINKNIFPEDTVLTENVRLGIFPEGGNLVSGISSVIAYKATDGKGNPVELEGMLYQDNEPFIELKTTHMGMGSLSFMPVVNKQYKIVVPDNNQSFPLPDIYPQGMVMQLLEQENDTLHFCISQSDNMPMQEIYLIGQMRGVVYCAAKGKIGKELKIKIPVDNFPYQGIAEFTLLNQQLEPVAERLVYLHTDKKLTVTAELSK